MAVEKEVYQLTDIGLIAIDKSGNQILENYSRYWPEITDSHTWIALLMIFIGFLSVYILDRYGNKANPI